MNYSPDALAVRKLDWDFFVTLTHAGSGWNRKPNGEKEIISQGRKMMGLRGQDSSQVRLFNVPNKARQAQRFNAFIFAVCRAFKIKPRNFVWVRRWEKGRGGRDHFHLLIRLPIRCRSSVKSCKYRLENIWSSKLEYGMAKVRPVHNSEGVAGYIAKVVNDYEDSRFTTEQYRSVMFSTAAIRAMSRRTAHVAHIPHQSKDWI